MIVQELHHLQHQFGYLPKEELHALAERINVALYQLHQVASFFPHFRLEEPPKVDVRICRDMACHLHGGRECRGQLEALAREIGGNQVAVGGVSCLGQCDNPVAALVNDQVYRGKSSDELGQLVRLALAGQPLPSQAADSRPLGWKIDPYNGSPRYECVKAFIEAWKADSGADVKQKRVKTSEPILKTMETAKLRGMGGAGFPTWRKWTTVRDVPADQKYALCNGDESEPGTFKDRELFRRTPHLVVEGIIMAGIVTGATEGWIFIRHEYAEEIAAVRAEIARARQMGVCGDRILGTKLSFALDVFVSPGGYICGEETALMEAMEDRRAEPRNKPPLSVFEGFRGKPTVINNVETYSWVPSILKHGGPWYRDQGTNGAAGLRFVSISGDVVRPGVYEVPFGQTVRELVIDTAGGVSGGQKLKAIATSGPSGGFLPASCPIADLPKDFIAGLVQRKVLSANATTFNALDLPLDSDLLKPFPDLMLGAAFVVYGDRRNMAEQALNCVEFFRNESCGKCVPCRVGSQKLAEMLRDALEKKRAVDLGLVKELGDAVYDTAICGLGQVMPNPIKSAIRYFPADLAALLQTGAR